MEACMVFISCSCRGGLSIIRMGCVVSSKRVQVSAVPNKIQNVQSSGSETIVAALSRIDDEIAHSEKSHPSARMAVVVAELDVIQQEINTFEETTRSLTKDSYASTMHHLFLNLDLYRRPMLATDNEDFVANVNRKEMHRLELQWLRKRQAELQREKRSLQTQILHLRAQYAQLQDLLESIWGAGSRPGTPFESALKKATSLRDALSSVSAKLRAAAEYAHSALRLLDDALPAWKLTAVAKSGWSRTESCADACRLLVEARCGERGARRVLRASAAPRAARALRLALDYAFTDTMHDHKYERATETFQQFKDALIQLIDSIHQVLLSNLENLTVAENDVTRCRTELRAARVNAIVQKGLAELHYHPRVLRHLKSQNSVRT